MAKRVVKTVRLDLDQRKGEWEFSAWLDGHLVAVMKAVPEGEHVLIHLQARAWSRELCREYFCCFMAIREFLRDSGCKLLMACSDHGNRKMMHFWRLMGFKVFGEIETQGRTFAYAVMEA
jgi:hypothetical protein